MPGVGHAQNAWLSVSDTIAGASTSFRASGLLDTEKVQLQLHRPDGTEIRLATQADDQGVIEEDLFGLHLQQSGDYTFEVLRQGIGLSASTDFQVIPGGISAYRSEIRTQELSAPADQTTKIPFEVWVRDAFGNPLVGKSVQMLSSRNEDRLPESLVTDSLGSIQGVVTSRTPGVSVLSAVVEDRVLFTKPEVVFYLPGNLPFAVGSSDTAGVGDFLKAQLFDSGQLQQVVSFSIADIASDVQTDQHLTVRVAARDVGGGVASQYTGTIRFSSSDDRAQLPADYTFTLEDQGEHVFYLSLTFSTLGSQTLNIHEVANFEISGEKTVNVVSGGPPQNIPGGEVPLEILTPTPGAYQIRRATITGSASACTDIKLVDGPTVLVEGLATDLAGNFVYQTPTLGEGTHEFQALCAGDETVASEKVRIQVDRSPPTDFQFHFSPSETVDRGSTFQFHFSANEDLSAVQCSFGGTLHDLAPGVDGAFAGSLYAPNTCGDYPVVCTAMDVLGNENEEPQGTVIRVCKPGEADGQINQFPLENQPPSAPTNLQAESGIDRVTLFWSPALDDKGIDRYRIEFSCLNLASIYQGETGLIFDKINETPDDRTQWYVSPIRDDEKCFFRVVAIDTDDAESDPSDVVEGVTLGAPDDIIGGGDDDGDDDGPGGGDDDGPGGDDGDGEKDKDPEQELEKSGGSYSTWMLLLVALLFGSGMVLMTRRQE